MRYFTQTFKLTIKAGQICTEICTRFKGHTKIFYTFHATDLYVHFF